MPSWLTPEIVLGFTLLTSFALVGLLSLWAATSPRHWLVRTIVVLALLAALLLIPAYEPLLVFAIQAGVIVAGAKLWQSRLRPQIRFSMRTLLLLIMPLAAAGALIAAQVAAQGREAWTTIALLGVASGCAVLLGAWMSSTRRPLITWPIAIFLCIGIGIIVIWQDWFVISMLWTNGWPPNPAYWEALPGSREAAMWVRGAVWLGTFCGLTFVTCAAGLLAAASFRIAGAQRSSPEPTTAPSPRRTFVRVALATFAFVVAAWPAYVFWHLTHPDSLPSLAQIESNGLDDIIAAAASFSVSPILSVESEQQPSTSMIKAEVTKHAKAYARLSDGLRKEIRVRTWELAKSDPKSFGLDRQALVDVQTAGISLTWAAELARREGRFDDAVQHSLDTLHLSTATTRGGGIIEFVNGMNIERMAVTSIYPALPNLSETACRQLIDAFVKVDVEREPFDETLRRDWALVEIAGGWSGPMLGIINGPTRSNAGVVGLIKRNRIFTAISRLLICELAVRAYTLEHGAPPQNLHQLVPAYLAKLPADPFDAEGGPMRYVRTETGYVVYSIAPDGQDNGGQPSQPNQRQGADLRLDSL